MNVLQFGVYILGAACCWCGSWLARKFPGQWWMAAPLMVLAIPCAVYGLYYARLWDEPIWLYQLRAVPGAELLAALGGLLVGWFHWHLPRRFAGSLGFVSCFFLLWLSVPYLKQLISPLRKDQLHEKWKDGVCMQSTTSTCGPASAATLLKSMGIEVTEKELATEAFTTSSGTENWYLNHALQRRGIDCSYVLRAPGSSDLLYPAIAGVRLGARAGHFIAIIGETPEHYIVGEPLSGRRLLRKDRLDRSGYEFTGFFMLLKKNP
ncbi:peptidase C39-like protein [Roseimicrobium gellanilyticum]|uniref:Peptidase C39-like protein n=1 Tax=Roseimicrobium gellanilyticum TaxID=748857 RepID=A0A366HUS1_9BACT|nr:cysteine peptidase family C39 domain-containing protein [Roseimicrobium gellanilyticum]RBP47429.1 peptidase C39-like protein [Roseimicrobium gellanilyticum]